MTASQAMMTAISTGNTKGTESRRVSIELPLEARERRPSVTIAPIQCVASKTTGSLPDNIAKKRHDRPSVVIPGESPFSMANQNSRRVSNGSIFPDDGMYTTLTSGMLGGGPVSKTGSMSNQHTNSSRRRASSVSMMSSLTSFNGRRYSIPATPESRYWPSDVGAMGFCQSTMTSLASLSLYPTNSLYQMPELGEASMTSTISGIEGASSSNGFQGYGGGLADIMTGADFGEAPMVSAISSSMEVGSSHGYSSYGLAPPPGPMSMIPSASSSSTPLSAQNSGLMGIPLSGYPPSSQATRNYVGGMVSQQLQAAQAAAMVSPQQHMQTPPMHHPQPHLNQQQQLLNHQAASVLPPPPPPPTASQLHHHSQMLLHQPDSMGPTNTVRSGGSPPPVSASAPPVSLQQQVYMAGQMPPAAYYHGNYVLQLPPAASASGSGAGLGPPPPGPPPGPGPGPGGPNAAGVGGGLSSRGGYPQQVVGSGGLAPQISPGYGAGGACAPSLSNQSMSPHTTSNGAHNPGGRGGAPMAAPAPAHGNSAIVGGVGGREPVTTIMLRNIPQRFNRESLMDDMDARGFLGSYDFFYLPIDFSTTHSVGYAFINFVNDEFALQFQEQWHKQRLPDCPTRKSLNISFATIQGLRANVMQVKKKRRRCLEVRQCHPIIMMHGRQVSLDEALDIYNGKAEPLSAGAA
mmetsp:Transcript_85799/g.179269  ORF Transcript_85799/g.179269 Transcript_85799/m.179269 type:complete len:688 (+) Transcript_85799:234-2297(+)